MSLKERIYSVLVVSSSEKFNTSLTHLLPESSFGQVHTAASITAAQRLMADQNFDMVVINSPLPDDQGVRFAIDMATSREAVVLLLVRSDIHDEIYTKVASYGVFTISKPTSVQVMSTAIRWMVSARESIRKYEKKTLSIEEKMLSIRLVNRAKWLLISELQMTEQEAHRYIEKQAMDRCVSRGQVAQEIIDIYS